MELPVVTRGADPEPPVSLDQLDHLTYLHGTTGPFTRLLNSPLRIELGLGLAYELVDRLADLAEILPLW